MSGEQRQKQLKDYTEEVAKLVPEYVKPIEEGKKVREGRRHQPASIAIGRPDRIWLSASWLTASAFVRRCCY